VKTLSAGQLGARLIQTPRLARIRSFDETRPSIPLLRRSNRFLRFHTASVNRAVLTSCPPRPFYPEQRTFSDPVGTSHLGPEADMNAPSQLLE
jgi:hypothetical protein